MKILDINIHGFGKFHGQKMSFHDGVNVVYGPNEAGKSTIHTYIRSMLYGLNKSQGLIRDNYSRFEPWSDHGVYEGEMRVEFEGKTYRIERVFKQETQKMRIVCENNNQVVENPDQLLFKMLCGMTEASYVNTVSIGQLKSSSEAGMSEELKKYITNLNTSGNISICTSTAVQYLREQKAKFEEKLIPNAVVNYSSNLEEITKIESSIKSQEAENRCMELNTLKDKENLKVKELNSQIEQYTKKKNNVTQTLKNAGFEIKRDITDLRYSTAKIYDQYKDIQHEEKSVASILLRPLSLALGVIILILHTFIIYALNPNILSEGQLSDFFRTLNPVVSKYPFLQNPAFTILMYVIGFGGLVFGIIATLKHFDRIASLRDITGTLQDVYSHQLGVNTINDQSFYELNAHLDKMEKYFYQKDECEDRIQELMDEKNSLDVKERKYLEELQKMQRTQSDLDSKLKRISDLKEECDQLQKAIQYNDEINKEISALNLSIETLQEISSQIKSTYGAYLNKEAFGLLSGISKGVYNSITIDDNLEVFLNTSGKEVPMDQVSSGTMDQIYLTIRLASATLIMNNSKEPLPLLFDDSFVMYDDERLASVLEWMAKNLKSQIIIFTCQSREQHALEERKVKFSMVNF